VCSQQTNTKSHNRTTIIIIIIITTAIAATDFVTAFIARIILTSALLGVG